MHFLLEQIKLPPPRKSPPPFAKGSMFTPTNPACFEWAATFLARNFVRVARLEASFGDSLKSLVDQRQYNEAKNINHIICILYKINMYLSTIYNTHMSMYTSTV